MCKPGDATKVDIAAGWPAGGVGQARFQAAGLTCKRRVSLALIAAILIVDLVIPWAGGSYLPRWQGLSFVPRAFVDEPCAVATALIVLGAITRFHSAPPDPKFGGSLLA